MPSLAQLDQAVREFIGENPTDQVTVVVDASFGHRIDPAELADFEEAEAAGEVVSPPAGAIGRGDAFLLRIAEKTGATVLSNDSFQEFHGEHVWLFEKGRLLGGKPVPGVGWIFMDRTPVRGAKSREVTKEAKRKKRAEVEVVHKVSVEPKPKARSKAVDRAIARATEEVVEPKSGSKSRRRRSSSPPAEPVNEPLAFITFIAAHPLGSDVVGTVLEYSSHGAFVEADGARCYIPLSAMASPPPRRAREVVTKGEPRSFVVQAFDPPRRGIELALPGFAKVAGGPTAETLEAEISAEPEELEVLAGVGGGAGTNGAGVVPADAAPARPARPGGRRSGRKAAAPVEAVPGPIMGPGGPVAAPSGPVPEVDLRTSRPTEGAEERPAARKSRAKKEPAQEAVAERVPAESEEAPVRPARGRKPASEGAPVAEPAPAPKKGAVKATAERAATAKRAAMAKRSATGEAVQAEATLPDLTAGASRKAPARAAATKAPARAAATKAAARKAASAVPAAGKAAAGKAPATKVAAGKAASAVPAAGRAAVKKSASAVPAAGKAAAGKAPATKVAAGKAASAVPARKPASAAGKPAARKAPATKAAAGKAASAVPAATKAAAGKAASAVPAAGKAAAGKAASAVPAARNAVGRKVAGPESGTGVGVEAGGPGASSPVRPARHGSSGG